MVSNWRRLIVSCEKHLFLNYSWLTDVHSSLVYIPCDNLVLECLLSRLRNLLSQTNNTVRSSTIAGIVNIDTSLVFAVQKLTGGEWGHAIGQADPTAVGKGSQGPFFLGKIPNSLIEGLSW